MHKPLPIGISDFKEIIDEGYAYVDKTLLIEELVEKGAKVALIPRSTPFWQDFKSFNVALFL